MMVIGSADPCQENVLAGNGRGGSEAGVGAGRYFVLAYDTDPHARVALEAYADSCAIEDPQRAEKLYRAVGFDIELGPSGLSEELLRYLARAWRGQWVAVRGGKVVAAGNTIGAVRAAVIGGTRCAVLFVSGPS